jgi:hypothetical protein
MSLPTDPVPLEKLSTLEMVHRIHRAFNVAQEEQERRNHELEKMIMALEAKVDGAFPGADYNKHKQDHDDIHELQRDAKQLKKDIWTRSITGLWLGFWALVLAALMYFFNIRGPK